MTPNCELMNIDSPTSMNIPAGHPEILHEKTGVLLANLGTPDGYDYFSMRRYLSEFLSDRRVIDYPTWFWQPLLQLIILSKRPFSSGRAYKSIWNTKDNESPLRTITKEQTEKVNNHLSERYGDQVAVEYCMRYGIPSVNTGVTNLCDQGCRKILFFPLYPQYSATTTATANDQLFRSLIKTRWQPTIRTVGAYYEHPLYIKILAKSVQSIYDSTPIKPECLLVSYHGLPKRYLELGDPYHCHCHKTTRLLREHLNWNEQQITTSFQSIFGREEWLKPYTSAEVVRLAHSGIENIALLAPGFSADCLETLEEISEEIREIFISAGGRNFVYIPCLNATDAHIGLLENIITENLMGWVED